MKKSPAVSKLNAILIATFVLAALPSAAHAASATVLARGAGYGNPNGSLQVQLLQQRLRLVGVNPGPIDGRFGPLTEAAVRRYQLRDGLVIDGLAGPRTRTALRHAVTQVGRGAGYGMRHGSNRIRRIQRSLRLVGARPGPIDGRFGPLTQAAVVRFQHSHGLAANGLAGRAMLDSLDRQVRNVSVEKPRSVKPANPTAGKPSGANPVKVRTGKPGNGRPVKVAAGSEGDARPAKATGGSRSTARPAKPTTAPPGRGGTPAPSGRVAPSEAPPKPYAGKDKGGRALARIELILFAAALVLAVAGILGVPEKVARRFAGSPPPPPAPKRAPVVEDVDPDPAGKVADGSRRPPRPKPPGHRLRPDRGDEPERSSSYR